MRKTLQKTKTSKKEEVEVTETTETPTNEVSEDAACCLLAIDEVLEDQKDVKNRELTDDEVYALGRPQYTDEKYVLSDGGMAWDAYHEDLERYKQAYEAVTGLTFNPCTC